MTLISTAHATSPGWHILAAKADDFNLMVDNKKVGAPFFQ